MSEAPGGLVESAAMKLSELVQGVSGATVRGDPGTEIRGLAYHTRDVADGTLFFCVPGLSFDRESREVRYESGGSVATCAVRKKILWGTTYPETGACSITVRSEPRIADTSAETPALTGWIVELATDEPTRSAGLKR